MRIKSKPSDCSSYDRNKDHTIDMCLSCKREKCIGKCDKIKQSKKGR